MIYIGYMNQDNIFILRMYFAEPADYEYHLNNDWTVILKNVKAREDQLFELLQHNKKIVTKLRDDQDELFVNDQIAMHQNEIKRIEDMNMEMEIQEKGIIEKYQSSVVTFEEIIKLMARVGARILQTYQYSIDKCKPFDDDLSEKHNKMKGTLVKLLNQKDKINLDEITNLVISYTKNKLKNQLQKLKKLVKALSNGDYDKLEQTYQPKKQAALSIQKKKISIEKVKVLSVGRTEKSPLRQQIKNQELIKKQKQKLAVKLVHGLYSTMDLSRQQFLEDMCGTEKYKVQKLYNDIFSRNRLNHEQIMAFQAKKDQFHQKIRIFKEMMQRQSQKIAEVILKKPLRKQRQTQQVIFGFIVPSNKIKDQNQKNTEQNLEDQMSESKNSSNRYRIHSPKSRRQSRQINLSMMQGTQQFNHFKFDTKNNERFPRSNRNKLPVIGNQSVIQQVNRVSSMDHRVQINKNKIIRGEYMNHKKEHRQQINNAEEIIINNQKKYDKKFTRQEKYMFQRAKVPLKNIEVGVDGVLKKQEGSKKQRKNDPSPMEYTFYVRKSNKKFYQPKHNIIF